MIVGLRGIVDKIEPMYIEIDANGVIYGVHMSLNATNALRALLSEKAQNTVKILCSCVIREDAHLLFGFVEEIEKQTFERLIKINGVGPKVALAILSTYTPTHFASIIANKDIDSLKKVPGIGAKGAGKIMVDIGGFFAELLLNTDAHIHNDSYKSEATLALRSLGFKDGDIAKALEGINSSNVSELVKGALKKLA